MKPIVKETEISKLFQFTDKVTIVTGAGGLGEVLALGFAPTAQAAAAFEAVAPVTVLGDAQQPRKILFAVGDAHEAVRKLSD